MDRAQSLLMMGGATAQHNLQLFWNRLQELEAEGNPAAEELGMQTKKLVGSWWAKPRRDILLRCLSCLVSHIWHVSPARVLQQWLQRHLNMPAGLLVDCCMRAHRPLPWLASSLTCKAPAYFFT